MKKSFLYCIMIAVFILAFSANIYAYDQISLAGTNTPPTIDGKLDDCYTKLHDFYKPNESEWFDSSDSEHKAAGECHATWDSDNLYVFIRAAENDYTPANTPTVASSGSCMYLSLLANLPDNNAPTDPLYVCQLAVNRSEDDTLEWKYTGSVSEEFRDNSVDLIIYSECPFKFEVMTDGTNTYYEIALPWNQIDRIGDQKFEVGHKFFFNYIVTIFNDGESVIAQYGQGLMNDIYDMGGFVELTAAPVLETAPPETQAPVSDNSELPSSNTQNAAQTFDIAIFAMLTCVLTSSSAFIISKNKKR